MWKKNFANVSIPRNLRQGICPECISLAEMRKQCSSAVEKEKYKQARKIHLQHVTTERREYRSR